MNLGWHFVGATLRDGRPIPPDDEWLVHTGPLVMCESGLHLSERVINALGYAPGETICRVEYDGEVERDDDKLVCSRRRILWRVDGSELLRTFARQCASDVLHLWDAPQVVRDYLATGDESLREAARDVARVAAWEAARNAAWDAARYAAWAASRAACRDAARNVAWDAAWAAACDAARNVAWDAAWAAARKAAWDAQNIRLESLIEQARSA